MRANKSQLDCAHTESGIKNLRAHYESLIDAGAGLEESTEWLDNDDEILKRMPLLEKGKIEVRLELQIRGR